MSAQSLPLSFGVRGRVLVGLGFAAVLGLAIPDQGALVLAWLMIPAGALLLLAKPMLGLLLMAATLPLESVVTFGTGTGGAATTDGGTTATKILGMVVFGVWFSHKILRREPWRHIWSNGFFKVFLFLFSLGSASLLWAKFTSNTFAGLFQLFQLVLWSALIIDLVNSWRRAIWLVRILVMATIITTFLALKQYYFAGASRAGLGIAGGINKTSALMVTIIPLAFYLIRSRGSRFWCPAGLLYLVLSPVAIVLTFSRQSYLLMPLTILGQYWETFKTRTGRAWLFLVTGTAVIVVLLAIPPELIRKRVLVRMNSIIPYLRSFITGESEVASTGEIEYGGRRLTWQVGMLIFQDHPLFGAGYNNYVPHYIDYQFRALGFFPVSGGPRWLTFGKSPHTSYVAFLADLGLVGLAVWLGVLGVILLNLTKSWRLLARTKPSNQFLFVQAVTYSVLLQITYGFAQQIHTEKFFWLLAALSVAVRQLAERTVQHSAGFSDQVPVETWE